MSEILQDILHSSAFWTFALGFVNALQKWLLPGIPDAVMISFNGLVGAIALVIAGRYVAVRIQVRALAQAREARAKRK